MATGNNSNRCSVCNKAAGVRQLAIKFDDEVVKSHDELLDQVQKLEGSNYLSSDLFSQIEQWKKTAIEKIERAAEKAHHELTKLIDKKRTEITKQLQSITKDIRLVREEENFLENDIDQLKQVINKIKQQLGKLIQKDKTQTIIIENNQIDWNRLIYIREIEDEWSIEEQRIIREKQSK
ncbi:unnamed protein product, partial [Rotaria sp. Silwood1]